MYTRIIILTINTRDILYAPLLFNHIYFSCVIIRPYFLDNTDSSLTVWAINQENYITSYYLLSHTTGSQPLNRQTYLYGTLILLGKRL